jgi:hypothetical protein
MRAPSIIAAVFLVGCLTYAQTGDTFAQTPAGTGERAGGGASANDLVQQAVDNDLKAADQDRSHWMYREKSGKTGETAKVIETGNGTLKRVIARNGQPLTKDQQAAEDQKMDNLVKDPQAQQKQQQAEDADAKKTEDLLRMLPKALSFTYAGGDASSIKLAFKPNPQFHPPSREAKVFHEMEGQLVVSRKEKRIVEFSGHLMQAVQFGILGHLDQGGTFDVRQEDVGQGHWEITRLKVNMKGKALFFKTIDVQQDDSRSEFHKVPNTVTLAQAEEMLRKQAD